MNLSINTALTILDCNNNSLTSLDVSANTALTYLACSFNSLTSLNVITNTALTSLQCHFNSLTSLNVSTNTALTSLQCHFNSLTSLNVSTNKALTTLTCYNNPLSSLNVSTNTNLDNLQCNNNSLTSLNISANPAISVLNCSNNLLTSLNVSSNTALVALNCSNNLLTSLNVKNTNNTNFVSVLFSAINNPNLTCIEVDNAAYSTTNWTNIDGTASFSEDCSLSTSIYHHLLENNINIYPNPTKEQINFSVHASVQLTNVTGQIIAEKKNVNSLDLSDQPTGIYFLTLIDNNGQVFQQNKIVKEQLCLTASVSLRA